MKKFSLCLLSIFISIFLCHGQQQKENSQQVIKLLAIGNSFSEDAIEQYLFELAGAADRKIIIGNLFIGGAPLALHVENAMENKAAYGYRKTILDGQKISKEKVSLQEALQDEEWDYISLQQASTYSGQYDVVIKSLPALVEYVQAQASKNSKLVYHQTWAYHQDSKHDGFKNYQNNQQTMYESIVKVTKKLQKSDQFDMIIPSGTAIQNARTSTMGDTFTRDGYHLELNYGRFTAACVWYEKLFGLDVRKNPYHPSTVTPAQAKISKVAAHKASKKPFKVSKVHL